MGALIVYEFFGHIKNGTIPDEMSNEKTQKARPDTFCFNFDLFVTDKQTSLK